MKRILLILALLLTVVSCSNPQVSNRRSTRPVVQDGKKAIPEFELTNVAGGSLKDTDLKGKVAVVDFWATWCSPCLTEIPKINKLKKKYTGKDVEIVGVTVRSGSAEDIKPKVEEFQMQYSVVVGDDKVAEGFGLIGYPTTFLVSKDGTIYKAYLGLPPNKSEQLEKDIDALLNH